MKINQKSGINNLKIFIYITTILLFPDILAFSSEVTSPSSLGIHTDTDRLADDAGRQVILRGVNAGGRSKLPPFYPFDPEPDFDTALARYVDGIQSLGFNVVRLLIIYEAAEPVRGQYNGEYLAIYDKMVKALGARGIRVIVDGHQDIFNRRLCGDGFPDWALPVKYRSLPQHSDCKFWSFLYFTRPVSSSFDRFWENADGIQDRYIQFFKMLAERYKDESAVIGFEPINEPMPGRKGMANYSEWHRQLYKLYEKVGTAVHAADPRFLIFADICPLENTGAWNTMRPRPEITNLVFSPHYYDPGTFGMSLGHGGDKWLMKNGLHKHLQQARFWNVPMLVTEYGISPIFKEAPLYIVKLYSVFDEFQLSGTFWEASMSKTVWNMENTSIFEPDGSLRPRAVNLNRPYPRALAGKIKSFSFDPHTAGFQLTWVENPKISMPTEIYLPKHLYPNGPKHNLDADDKFSFDPNSGVLSIYPRNQGKQRELTVTP